MNDPDRIFRLAVVFTISLYVSLFVGIAWLAHG